VVVQVQQVLKEHKVPQDRQVQKEHKEQRDIEELKVRLVVEDQVEEQVPQVQQVLKGP
jgi:hypothetical protein